MTPYRRSFFFLFSVGSKCFGFFLDQNFSKIPPRDNQEYKLLRRYKELSNLFNLNLYITGFPLDSIKMRFEILSQSVIACQFKALLFSDVY